MRATPRQAQLLAHREQLRAVVPTSKAHAADIRAELRGNAHSLWLAAYPAADTSNHTYGGENS